MYTHTHISLSISLSLYIYIYMYVYIYIYIYIYVYTYIHMYMLMSYTPRHHFCCAHIYSPHITVEATSTLLLLLSFLRALLSGSRASARPDVTGQRKRKCS